MARIARFLPYGVKYGIRREVISVNGAWCVKSFIPPAEVQANARRALEVRASKPPSERGMLAEGISRARDLSNGKAIPLDTIKRMYSFFERHEVDKQGSSWDTYGKGWQAWMGWGGDAGRRWVKRILRQYSDDTPSLKSTRAGTSIDKAGEGMMPGMPPQGMPPQGAPPQGMPGMPPQGAPPQGMPGQPPADPNAPPADPNNPQGQQAISIEPMGEGRFREVNSGKEFQVEQTVPKDDDKIKNDRDTTTYLESSGLKAAKDALSNLAVLATESQPADTKRRLFHAGLLDFTNAGTRVSRYGKELLRRIDANKPIADKEKEIKEVLYQAEQYAKQRAIIMRSADAPAQQPFFNTITMPYEDRVAVAEIMPQIATDDVVTVMKAFQREVGSTLEADERALFARLAKALNTMHRQALLQGDASDAATYGQKMSTTVTRILSQQMKTQYQPLVQEIVKNFGSNASDASIQRVFNRLLTDYLVNRHEQLAKTTETYLSRDLEPTKTTGIAFGNRRAEIIAVTESSYARSLVAKTAQIVLNKSGVSTQLVWHTATSDRGCSSCSALHGTVQGDGWTDPPPLHPYCRCTVRIEKVYDKEK